MTLTTLLGVIRWSNTFTLGSAVVGVVISLITVGGFIWLVVRARGREKDLLNRIASLESRIKVAEGNADSWHEERDAFASKAERLTDELADERVRCTKQIAAIEAEQTELRHALKAELAATQHLLEAEKKKPDQTVVVEGLTQILERLTTAEQTGVATVAKLLESMEERAARRDAAIVDTQQQIVAQLSRVAEVVADRVGEVVQQKVEQLQEEAP